MTKVNNKFSIKHRIKKFKKTRAVFILVFTVKKYFFYFIFEINNSLNFLVFQKSLDFIKKILI